MVGEDEVVWAGTDTMRPIGTRYTQSLRQFADLVIVRLRRVDVPSPYALPISRSSIYPSWPSLV